MSRQELRSTGGNCQGDDRQESYSSAGNCQADEPVEFARDLMKHMPEFRRAFQGHKYEFTEDGGIIFPAQKAICHGLFIHSVNGEDERSDKNMWVTEGRNHAPWQMASNVQLHDCHEW